MANARAWVLDLGGGVRAAVGEREIVLLLYDAPTFRVPYSPPYCGRVLFWGERALPVFDLAVRVGASSAETPTTFVAIVGYPLRHRTDLAYGALPLAAPPVRAEVDDDKACALPAERANWGAWAVSCFADDSGPVPVVDLERLFAGSAARRESLAAA